MMEPVPNPALSRIRGWMLIVIGLGLSLGMLWLTSYLSWTIAHNNRPERSHWNGSRQCTIQVFELFGAIFLFGVAAFVGGVLLLRRGRPSWPIIVLSLGLFAIMCFLGWQIVQSKG